jgi:hypothetical protein
LPLEIPSSMSSLLLFESLISTRFFILLASILSPVGFFSLFVFLPMYPSK